MVVVVVSLKTVKHTEQIEHPLRHSDSEGKVTGVSFFFLFSLTPGLHYPTDHVSAPLAHICYVELTA